MNIFKTDKSVYMQSEKYPALQVELILSDKDTEETAEQKLLEQLQKAEAEYEQNINLMPDDKGNLVEIPKDKPTLNTIRRWIRQYRNQLLKDSDFSMLPDATVISKTSWQTYRQQLRNLPKTWNLDDKPSIDLSGICSFDDVATLPFPKPPE